ncbi:MAG: hypothetical protein CBC84_002285 [Pelagibacteraceae bacterium TMED124]|nr:MAG: hypothetical protein CBC84_002285 [Pelagibacteraceae bacterium TMED124]
MENDPLWIFLHPTKKKDKHYGVSIGTKLEFRSKKYVVEPSILNHINLTHKKLAENGKCINNAITQMAQYISTKPKLECNFFNNVEDTSLTASFVDDEHIKLSYKNNIDKILKDVNNEWAIFKIWEKQKFKQHLQKDSIIILKNILFAYVYLFNEKHSYYRFRRTGTNSICHSTYNKNDFILLKLCLKSCILYYLDPEIKKNSIKKIKSILKNKQFRNKVFSLFYHIQVKHKHKFLIDGYNTSNRIKNKINAILYTYNKLYAKSNGTSDLYTKYIMQKYVNLFPISVNEIARWRDGGGGTLMHITKTQEYKAVTTAHKTENDLFFKIATKQCSEEEKDRIEKEKSKINGKEWKSNLVDLMNNINYATSWGKISTILSVFFQTIVSSLFESFFNDDNKICHFDSFHRFIELYIRKGPTILFMVSAIIISEYIIKIENSSLNFIIPKEPDFEKLNIDGNLNEDYKTKLKTDYEQFFEITKLKAKSSEQKSDQLNFTIILEKLYKFIEYIEEGWDNIDEIANFIMKDLTYPKPFTNKGGTYYITDIPTYRKVGSKPSGLYFNPRTLKELKYRQIITEPNNIEMFGINIDKEKPWYKDFKDNIKGAYDDPGKDDKIKFICFDYFDLPKLAEKYHIKDKNEEETKKKDDFCLNFVSSILPNNVGDASDLIHVSSEEKNCFYSNVTSAQKKYIELMKHKKDDENEDNKKYSLQFDLEDEPSDEMKQEMKEIEDQMKESNEKPENLLLQRIEREKDEKRKIVNETNAKIQLERTKNAERIKELNDRIKRLEQDKNIGSASSVDTIGTDIATSTTNVPNKTDATTNTDVGTNENILNDQKVKDLMEEEKSKRVVLQNQLKQQEKLTDQLEILVDLNEYMTKLKLNEALKKKQEVRIEKREQIKIVSQDVTQYTNKIKELQNKLDDATTKLNQSKRKIGSENAQSFEDASKIETFTEEINELKIILKEKEEKSAETTILIQNLEKKGEFDKNALNEFKTKYDKMILEQKEKLDKLSVFEKDLQDKLKISKEELTLVNNKLIASEKEVTDLKVQLEEATTNMDDKEKKVRTLEKELEVKENELKAEKEKVKQMMSDIEKNQSVKDAQALITLEEHNKKYKELQKQVITNNVTNNNYIYSKGKDTISLKLNNDDIQLVKYTQRDALLKMILNLEEEIIEYAWEVSDKKKIFTKPKIFENIIKKLNEINKFIEGFKDSNNKKTWIELNFHPNVLDLNDASMIYNTIETVNPINYGTVFLHNSNIDAIKYLSEFITQASKKKNNKLTIRKETENPLKEKFSNDLYLQNIDSIKSFSELKFLFEQYFKTYADIASIEYNPLKIYQINEKEKTQWKEKQEQHQKVKRATQEKVEIFDKKNNQQGGVGDDDEVNKIKTQYAKELVGVERRSMNRKEERKEALTRRLAKQKSTKKKTKETEDENTEDEKEIDFILNINAETTVFNLNNQLKNGKPIDDNTAIKNISGNFIYHVFLYKLYIAFQEKAEEKETSRGMLKGKHDKEIKKDLISSNLEERMIPELIERQEYFDKIIEYTYLNNNNIHSVEKLKAIQEYFGGIIKKINNGELHEIYNKDKTLLSNAIDDMENKINQYKQDDDDRQQIINKLGKEITEKSKLYKEKHEQDKKSYADFSIDKLLDLWDTTLKKRSDEKGSSKEQIGGVGGEKSTDKRKENFWKNINTYIENFPQNDKDLDVKVDKKLDKKFLIFGEEAYKKLNNQNDYVEWQPKTNKRAYEKIYYKKYKEDSSDDDFKEYEANIFHQFLIIGKYLREKDIDLQKMKSSEHNIELKIEIYRQFFNKLVEDFGKQTHTPTEIDSIINVFEDNLTNNDCLNSFSDLCASSILDYWINFITEVIKRKELLERVRKEKAFLEFKEIEDESKIRMDDETWRNITILEKASYIKEFVFNEDNTETVAATMKDNIFLSKPYNLALNYAINNDNTEAKTNWLNWKNPPAKTDVNMPENRDSTETKEFWNNKWKNYINLVDKNVYLHFNDLFQKGKVLNETDDLNWLSDFYIDYTKSYYILNNNHLMLENFCVHGFADKFLINKDERRTIDNSPYKDIVNILDQHKYYNWNTDANNEESRIKIFSNLILNLLIKLLNTYIYDIPTNDKFNFTQKINVQIFLILISLLYKSKISDINNYKNEFNNINTDSLIEKIKKKIEKMKKESYKTKIFGSNILDFFFRVEFTTLTTEEQREDNEEKNARFIKQQKYIWNHLERFIDPVIQTNINNCINSIMYILNPIPNNAQRNNEKKEWMNILKEHPFLFNTLTSLYKESMIPIKVITKLTDVQCIKNNEMQKRNYHDYFISNDGKKLLYAYKGKDLAAYTSIKNENNKYKHFFMFDYMDYIFGPWDDPKSMSVKLNKDIYNIFPINPNKRNLKNMLYFTYGFSGSGKTYTTKELLNNILKYIIKTSNNDRTLTNNINKIKIKYTEVASCVIKKKDILCSGRLLPLNHKNSDFNTAFFQKVDATSPHFRIMEWLDFNENTFKHIEKPIYKIPPCINASELDTNNNEKKYINFKNCYGITNDDLFESIYTQEDWENKKETNPCLKLPYYIEKNRKGGKKEYKWNTIELIFNDTIHSTYWCRDFFKITETNKLEASLKNDTNLLFSNVMVKNTKSNEKMKKIQLNNKDVYVTPTIYGLMKYTKSSLSDSCEQRGYTFKLDDRCVKSSNWYNYLKRIFIKRFEDLIDNMVKKTTSTQVKKTETFNNQTYWILKDEYTKLDDSRNFFENEMAFILKHSISDTGGPELQRMKKWNIDQSAWIYYKRNFWGEDIYITNKDGNKKNNLKHFKKIFNASYDIKVSVVPTSNLKMETGKITIKKSNDYIVPNISKLNGRFQQVKDYFLQITQRTDREGFKDHLHKIQKPYLFGPRIIFLKNGDTNLHEQTTKTFKNYFLGSFIKNMQDTSQYINAEYYYELFMNVKATGGGRTKFVTRFNPYYGDKALIMPDLYDLVPVRGGGINIKQKKDGYGGIKKFHLFTATTTSCFLQDSGRCQGLELDNNTMLSTIVNNKGLKGGIYNDKFKYYPYVYKYLSTTAGIGIQQRLTDEIKGNKYKFPSSLTFSVAPMYKAASSRENVITKLYKKLQQAKLTDIFDDLGNPKIMMSKEKILGDMQTISQSRYTDFNQPIKYYISSDIVKKMQDYLNEKGNEENIWKLLLNGLTLTTWEGNVGKNTITNLHNQTLTGDDVKAFCDNNLWETSSKEGVSSIFVMKSNDAEATTLSKELGYMTIEWFGLEKIAKSRDAINNNVANIYKRIFKYIRQREVNNYYNTGKNVVEYKPLFLAKFKLDQWSGYSNSSIGINQKTSKINLNMICNVNGFENWIPNNFVNSWKGNFNEEDAADDPEYHKKTPNRWKLYNTILEEEEEAKKNNNEGINVKEWVAGLNYIKSEVFKGQTFKEDVTRITSANEKEFWFSSIDKTKITFLKKIFYLLLKTENNFSPKKSELIDCLQKYSDKEDEDDLFKNWKARITGNIGKDNSTNNNVLYKLKVKTTTEEEGVDLTKEFLEKIDDADDPEFYWEKQNDKLLESEKETVPQYITIYTKDRDEIWGDNKEAIWEKILKFHMDFIDEYKQKKATYNNDESSRSHMIYEILISQEGHEDENIGNKLIICDLAGKEDMIDAKKLSAYVNEEYNKSVKNPEQPNNMNFLNNLNRIYQNKKGGNKYRVDNEIFIVTDEEAKTDYNLLFYKNEKDEFKTCFDQGKDKGETQNKYLLDLLSEGRMINATLENLKDIIINKSTDSKYMTDFYDYYKYNSFDILKNVKAPKITFTPVNINDTKNISEQYKSNTDIAKREYNQLEIEIPNNGTVRMSDWFKVKDRLSLCIGNIKLNSNIPTTNYILLTINLNERSLDGDIESIQDIVHNEEGEGEEEEEDDLEFARYKTESTLSTLKFVNKLSLLDIESNDLLLMNSKTMENMKLLPEVYNNLNPLQNIKFNYVDDYKNICRKLDTNDINVLYRSPYYDLLATTPNQNEILLDYNKNTFKLTLGQQDTCLKYDKESKYTSMECDYSREETEEDNKTAQRERADREKKIREDLKEKNRLQREAAEKTAREEAERAKKEKEDREAQETREQKVKKDLERKKQAREKKDEEERLRDLQNQKSLERKKKDAIDNEKDKISNTKHSKLMESWKKMWVDVTYDDQQMMFEKLNDDNDKSNMKKTEYMLMVLKEWEKSQNTLNRLIEKKIDELSRLFERDGVWNDVKNNGKLDNKTLINFLYASIPMDKIILNTEKDFIFDLKKQLERYKKTDDFDKNEANKMEKRIKNRVKLNHNNKDVELDEYQTKLEKIIKQENQKKSSKNIKSLEFFIEQNIIQRDRDQTHWEDLDDELENYVNLQEELNFSNSIIVIFDEIIDEDSYKLLDEDKDFLDYTGGGSFMTGKGFGEGDNERGISIQKEIDKSNLDDDSFVKTIYKSYTDDNPTSDFCKTKKNFYKLLRNFETYYKTAAVYAKRDSNEYKKIDWQKIIIMHLLNYMKMDGTEDYNSVPYDEPFNKQKLDGYEEDDDDAFERNKGLFTVNGNEDLYMINIEANDNQDKNKKIFWTRDQNNLKFIELEADKPGNKIWVKKMIELLNISFDEKNLNRPGAYQIGGGKNAKYTNKRKNKSLKRMKLKRNISLKGGKKPKLKKRIRKTLKKKKRKTSFKLKNLKIQSKARRNRNTLKKRK